MAVDKNQQKPVGEEFGGKRKVIGPEGKIIDQSWGRVQTPDLGMSSFDKLNHYNKKK